MKTLLIFAHPLVDGSFNHALKEILELNQQELKVSDLYQMKFKAVADWGDFEDKGVPPQYAQAQKAAFEKDLLTEDIQEELEKIAWAERILFQFPLWWFSVPAIMKGYFDRVLVKGIAYDKGKWFETGPFRGKKARLVLTTQSPESSYTEGEIHGPIDIILKPIHHTLKLTGLSIEKPFVAYGVDGGTQELREGYLKKFHHEFSGG